MLKLIKRWLLWLQIYEVNITINGYTKMLELVSSPFHKNRIEVARTIARAERARLRGEYNETLPVGQRVIWSMA